MRESALEAKIRRHCRVQGLLCYKFVSPSNKGVPDRLIMGKGRAMFLEVKKPGEKPDDMQEYQIARLVEAGIHATWADNYQTAVEIIDDFFA